MIDLFALAVSESEASSRRSCKGSAYSCCYNRTDDRMIVRGKWTATQFLSVSFTPLRSRRSIDSRLDYRPSRLVPITDELETRKILGKSLYIFRGDVVRSLVELYGLYQPALMRLSINQLQRVALCSKGLHDLRACRNHDVVC